MTPLGFQTVGLSLARSFARSRVLLPFGLPAFFLWFRMEDGRRKAMVVWTEKEKAGGKGEGGEEGRSFVCGPRGVLGQLGAEVSRCVWYATVSCVAPPSRPT